jgi:hypothetical protein
MCFNENHYNVTDSTVTMFIFGNVLMYFFRPSCFYVIHRPQTMLKKPTMIMDTLLPEEISRIEMCLKTMSTRSVFLTLMY